MHYIKLQKNTLVHRCGGSNVTIWGLLVFRPFFSVDPLATAQSWWFLVFRPFFSVDPLATARWFIDEVAQTWPFGGFSFFDHSSLLTHYENSCLPQGRPGFDSRQMQQCSFRPMQLAFPRLNPGQKKDKSLPVGELNPGLPRDRRGYYPLY